MSNMPEIIGQTPYITLLVAVGAGLAAGLLSNWAADTLPYIGTDRRSPNEPVPAEESRPAGVSIRLHRSPLVLAAMLVLFISLAVHQHAEPAQLLVNWCYAWFLVTVLVIDLETRRVLNLMLLPAAVFAVAAGLWLGDPSLPSMLAGATVAFGLFWFLYVFGRKTFGRGALGFGDVKLVAVIGLMTGYPNVLQALVLGATLGGVAAVFLIVTRRAGWKSTCAYAPYLAVGAMLALWTRFGG
jgi:leader peptidase (prepilin peptidase)/N-methyltransferase